MTTSDVKGAGAGATAPAPAPVGQTELLDLDEVGGRVERTELPGGLRVLTETMPGVLSATLGIWVGVGSRDESVPEAGASHYLEHLLFKGTPRRSALDISASLEAVGGDERRLAGCVRERRAAADGCEHRERLRREDTRADGPVQLVETAGGQEGGVGGWAALEQQ